MCEDAASRCLMVRCAEPARHFVPTLAFATGLTVMAGRGPPAIFHRHGWATPGHPCHARPQLLKLSTRVLIPYRK